MAVKLLTLQNYYFKIMIWHYMGKSINSWLSAMHVNRINIRLDQLLLDILYSTEYLVQRVCQNIATHF